MNLLFGLGRDLRDNARGDLLERIGALSRKEDLLSGMASGSVAGINTPAPADATDKPNDPQKIDRADNGAHQPASGNKTSIFGTFASYIEPGEYRLTVMPVRKALTSALTSPSVTRRSEPSFVPTAT